MTDTPDTAREVFPAVYFPPKADDLELDFTVAHVVPTAADPTEEPDVDAPKPAPEPATPADSPVTTPPAAEDAEGEAKATHPTKAQRSTSKAPTPKVPAPPKTARTSDANASVGEDDPDDTMF